MIRTQSRFRYLLFTFLVASFALAAACGGGDDDGDGGDNGGSNPTATPSGSNNTGNQGNDNGGGLTDLEPETAVVIIGGERFDFSLTSPFADACITLFGVVGGVGNATDGSDIEIDIEIPPEDYEGRRGYEDFIPEIQVRDDVSGRTFRAGGDFEFAIATPEDGESQIDSYRNDGKSATGTATFMDLQALSNHEFNGGPRPEPVKGTFEINCG